MSNSIQTAELDFRKQSGSSYQSKALRPFDITFHKIFADRASSNRTEQASGEGSVDARPKCIDQTQADQDQADKPVPRYAASRPRLQKMPRTLGTSILKFTDTSATGAGPSNPWLSFARRRCNRSCKSNFAAVISNCGDWRKDWVRIFAMPTNVGCYSNRDLNFATRRMPRWARS